MQLNIENIPYRPGEAIVCLENITPRVLCPFHCHEEVEILLIDSSHGRFLAGDYIGEFRPGDVFLLGANLPHVLENPEDVVSPAPDWARTRVIQFREEFLGPEFLSRVETVELVGLLERARRGYVYRGKEADALLALINAVHGSAGLRRVTTLLELLSFWIENEQSCETLASQAFVSPIRSSDVDRLSKLTQFVHSRLATDITLADAAAVAGMSPAGFSRFFRQRTGVTFVHFLNQMRLAEARRLLLQTDLTVTEILFRCGFQTVANFNRQFKRATGFAPTEFRKRGECSVDALALEKNRWRPAPPWYQSKVSLG